MQSISEWLQSLGLDQYIQVFADNFIDLEVLPDLTDAEFKELGVPLGHRKKLLKAIAERGDATVAAPSNLSTSQRLPIESGERRQATILFSDLSGFTAMTEKLDPEDVQGLMRRLKDGAVAIVERHGGIVSQFVGDEVLALFGIPLAHEDDPVRAVRAAQDIHALARELSPEAETRIGRTLRMHTGIDTGLVVTSTADTRDGTIGVTGDTVNTAARLKALAEDDRILVSPETQHLIADFFETEPLDAVHLKGKAKTVTPYRVTAETAMRSRFQAAKARGFTPYTGREEERQTLQRCLDKAIAGEGQFVTVMGEAGVGKSRLLHEFRQSIDRNKFTVLEGRCQIHGSETPYLPFLDALRRGLQVREEDSAAELAEKAVANILAIDPALERYVPHYLHLLSIASEDHPMPPELQGDALRRELEEALAASITHATQHQPIVLIYEDWHWADAASDSALKNIIGLLSGYPLMLVVLYRPEYTRAWSNPDNYTPLVLKPLGEANTEAISRSIFGANELPEGLAKAIHSRTEGNPFFTEEICNALSEDGSVVVADGTAALTKPLEDLHLPDTIQAVIRSRVDRLDPDSREILRLASVIGREFARSILASLFLAEARLSQGLAGLQEQDMVKQVRILPEAEYIFKHVLSQVVVYETLLRQQRKELHAQTGRAIETLYAGRLEEHYEALAHHYSQSNENEKAIEYLEKAGDKAAAYYSLGQARNQYQAAIGRIASAETEPLMRTFVDIATRWASISIGLPTQANIDALDRAQGYAERLSDDTRFARASACRGYIHLMLGEGEAAYAETQKVFKRQERVNDKEVLGIANSTMGRIAAFTHKPKDAIEPLEKALTLLREAGNLTEGGYNAGLSGWSYAYIGEFEKARERLDTARDWATTYGFQDLEAWVGVWTGTAQTFQANWESAIDHSDRGFAAAQSIQNDWTASWCLLAKAFALFMGRDATLGIELIRKEVRDYEAIGALLMFSWHLSFLAELLALAGVSVEGEAIAERSLALVPQGDNIGELRTLRARMILLASRTKPDWEAVDRQRSTAVALGERDGARPDVAITCFRHAECLHKKGDREAAREQLSLAEKLFAEMDMNWWSEQAEGLRGRIDSGAEFVWFAPYVDGSPQGIEQH